MSYSKKYCKRGRSIQGRCLKREAKVSKKTTKRTNGRAHENAPISYILCNCKMQNARSMLAGDSFYHTRTHLRMVAECIMPHCILSDPINYSNTKKT